jgi:membrane protease YdiL (CAAX protease family)
VQLLVATLDPTLHDRLRADPSLSHVAHRLLAAGRLLGIYAAMQFAMALPLLLAARLAFQRPAWTFVSPARPFSPKLLAWGMVVGLIFFVADVGPDLLNGATLAPPILDLRQPQADRIAYGLAVAPLILLAIAAEELVYRGVLLQVAAAFIRTRVGLCVVNGLTFALLRALLGESSPITMLGLTMAGAAFAYSVLELGGLELSLGARFSNFLVAILMEAPSAERSPPFHWSDLSRPDAWISLGATAAAALATVGAVRLIKQFRKA